jgi:hypothetical protein
VLVIIFRAFSSVFLPSLPFLRAGQTWTAEGAAVAVLGVDLHGALHVLELLAHASAVLKVFGAPFSFGAL